MTSIPLGHQDTNRVVSGAPSALVAFVRCARAGADFLSEVSANCASWVEGDERWPAASALLVTPARESWPAPADGQHVPATLTSATPPPGAITLTPAELDNYLGGALFTGPWPGAAFVAYPPPEPVGHDPLSEGVGAPPAGERFSTGEDLAGRPPVPGLSPALVGTSAAVTPWAQEHAAASRRRAQPGGLFPGGGSPRASPRARSSAASPGPASASAVADLRAGGTPRRLADSHELTSRAIEMLAESVAQQGGQLQQVLEQQQLMAATAAAPLPAGALGDGAATAGGRQQVLSQALAAAGSPAPRLGPPSTPLGGTALGSALPRAPPPLLGSSVVQRPRGPPLLLC